CGQAATKPCSPGPLSRCGVIGAPHVAPPSEESATRTLYPSSPPFADQAHHATRCPSGIFTTPGRSAQFAISELEETTVAGTANPLPLHVAKRSASPPSSAGSSHDMRTLPSAARERRAATLAGPDGSATWRISRVAAEDAAGAACATGWGASVSRCEHAVMTETI